MEGDDLAVWSDECRMHGRVGVGDERGEGPIGGNLGMGFNAGSMRKFYGCGVGFGEVELPDVAAILIEVMRIECIFAGLIGAVDEGVVVVGEGGILGLEVAGCEPAYGRITVRGDLVEMHPTVGLAIEIDG